MGNVDVVSSTESPGQAGPGGVLGARLSAQARINVRSLDQAMRQLWDLGRYVFLLWARRSHGIAVLRVPHEHLIGFLARHPDWVVWPSDRRSEVEQVTAEHFLMSLMRGSRLVSDDRLEAAARLLDADIQLLHVPHPDALRQGETARIDELMRRYGMSFHSGRAVVLLDIVDFSLFSPLEQVTQIHSLSTSLNWAHSALLHRRIDVRFARSSTGDGFYIWNRDSGARANINLYHLMHLMLANNALRRRSAPARSVPEVKTAFHVGSYYDIYLSEGLRPATDSVIVGNVTVELARILSAARPGQILVGDFSTALPDVSGAAAAPAGTPQIDSVEFIDAIQPTLRELRGIELLDDRLLDVRCYLTGHRRASGTFDISRYRVADKHGRQRLVFNAKVNITPEQGDPVYLGLQNHTVTLPKL